jgi:hypothetical protein
MASRDGKWNRDWRALARHEIVKALSQRRDGGADELGEQRARAGEGRSLRRQLFELRSRGERVERGRQQRAAAGAGAGPPPEALRALDRVAAGRLRRLQDSVAQRPPRLAALAARALARELPFLEPGEAEFLDFLTGHVKNEVLKQARLLSCQAFCAAAGAPPPTAPASQAGRPRGVVTDHLLAPLLDASMRELDLSFSAITEQGLALLEPRLSLGSAGYGAGAESFGGAAEDADADEDNDDKVEEEGGIKAATAVARASERIGGQAKEGWELTIPTEHIALAGLPHLVALDLSFCAHLGAGVSARLAQHCVGLRWLSLAGLMLRGRGARDPQTATAALTLLQHIPRLRALSVLDVSACHWFTLDSFVEAGCVDADLAAMPALKVLIADHCASAVNLVATVAREGPLEPPPPRRAPRWNLDAAASGGGYEQEAHDQQEPGEPPLLDQGQRGDILDERGAAAAARVREHLGVIGDIFRLQAALEMLPDAGSDQGLRRTAQLRPRDARRKRVLRVVARGGPGGDEGASSDDGASASDDGGTTVTS